MDGIFRLFKVTRGFIPPLNAVTMQFDFLTMITAIRSIQDIKYYAKYDLADVKYGGQAVYNIEGGQILTFDTLIYGDTIFEEFTTDPILFLKMGTLFPVNTYIKSYQGTFVITE